MAKKISLKGIEDSKISIDQGLDGDNVPKDLAREDVEILLENLKKVDAEIKARDKISYKDTDIETAIQSLESILSKAFEKKEDLDEAQKVLSQLKRQTPGVNIDQINNLMTKLLNLLKYANLGKPVIEQIWATLSRYFGLG